MLRKISSTLDYNLYKLAKNASHFVSCFMFVPGNVLLWRLFELAEFKKLTLQQPILHWFFLKPEKKNFLDECLYFNNNKCNS